MEEEGLYQLRVMVCRADEVLEEDRLCIKLQFYKCSGWHRQRSDPMIWDYITRVALKKVCFKFLNFRSQLSYETERVKKALIVDILMEMGAPEDLYAGILEQLFDVMKAAVSPENVIVVDVRDVIHTVGVRPSRPRIPATAASRLFIQGLEQVSERDTITCCICLEDFEQEPLTRLPCTHHFHVQCIVQWLEINHLCPICRCAMPTEDDA